MNSVVNKQDFMSLGIGILGTLVIFAVLFKFLQYRANRNRNRASLNTTDSFSPEMAFSSNNNTTTNSDSGGMFQIPDEIRDRVSLTLPNKYNFTKPCTLQSPVSSYFEVMLLSLPSNTHMLVGFAPTGISSLDTDLSSSNVVLDITDGTVLLHGQSVEWASLGEFNTGDLISCTITRSSPFRSGIQFAKNGIWSSPIPLPAGASHPTLSVSGPCRIQVHMSSNDFIYRSSCPSATSLPPSYLEPAPHYVPHHP